MFMTHEKENKSAAEALMGSEVKSNKRDELMLKLVDEIGFSREVNANLDQEISGNVTTIAKTMREKIAADNANPANAGKATEAFSHIETADEVMPMLTTVTYKKLEDGTEVVAFDVAPKDAFRSEEGSHQEHYGSSVFTISPAGEIMLDSDFDGKSETLQDSSSREKAMLGPLSAMALGEIAAPEAVIVTQPAV
jgi:hypothetical protein